jgi:Tol biopolymer transport system component
LDESETPLDPGEPQLPPSDRLDSWKKIAVYLKRDVSTVQRWERRESMPVHRHLHDKQGSVFAYRSELDHWWQSRRAQLTPSPPAPQRVPPDNRVPAATASPSSTPPPSSVPPTRSRLLGRGPAALALLLLAGALSWFLIDRTFSWRNPLANAKFSRLSDFAGTEQAAAISPNGKFVAFLASRGGQVDAWVGEIGTSAYRNLTQGAQSGLANPSIRTLGFSADSTLVSVWTRRGDGTQSQDVSIYAAPTTGGPLSLYLPDAAEFAWSRDGRWLVYHTTAPGDPLLVREQTTSAAHQIYVASAGVHCHYPIWSTDGAFIYFVRGVPPDDWDIWRIRRDGTNLERLTHHNARVSYPVMLDPRTLAYLATDADGSGPWIYGLDIERRVPHRLTSGLETYTSLAASADGMRLVATTANPRSSLWRVRLGNDKANTDIPGSTAPAQTTPAFIATNSLTPRLGPGFLVFLSSRNGAPGIWTLDKGTTREIWRDARLRIMGAPTLSPDGRHIAFTVDDGDHTRLLAMDKDGSHVTALAGSLKLQGNPAWSPDGNSIVSAAIYEGEPRLTRIFLNGAPPVALLGEYSVDPVWSSDGRYLIYSGRDIGTTFPVRAATADGRPYPIPSLILTRGARRLAILADPPALLVLRGDIAHKDIWAIDLQGHGERQLTTLPPDFTVNDFDISADGSELVLDKVEDNSDMALIERPR